MTTARNPRWANAAHTAVDLLVNHEAFGEIPFTATPDDPEPHGRDFHARAVSGEFGAIADYIPPPVFIPRAVSTFQATEALADAGYLDSVEAYFASASATALEKRAWKRITEVRRDSPMMAKLATMLGLSEAQLDALFVAAAAIEA